MHFVDHGLPGAWYKDRLAFNLEGLEPRGMEALNLGRQSFNSAANRPGEGMCALESALQGDLAWGCREDLGKKEEFEPGSPGRRAGPGVHAETP